MKTATERAIYGDIPAEGRRREMPVLGVLEKIAADTEKTQRGIQQLSGDLRAQHEIARLGDIDTEPVDTDEPSAERAKTPRIHFRERFNETAIEEIRRPQLKKTNDYAAFGEFAAESFYNREEFLKDEHKRSVIKRDDWVDWLYKINKDITGNLKKDTLKYRSYRAGVDSYALKQQQKSETPKRPPRKPQAKKIFSPKKPTDPPDTGKEATPDTEKATPDTEREAIPDNTLTQKAIKAIDQFNSDEELAEFAVESYDTREDYIKRRVDDKSDWVIMVYLASRGVNKIEELDNKKGLDRFIVLQKW